MSKGRYNHTKDVSNFVVSDDLLIRCLRLTQSGSKRCNSGCWLAELRYLSRNNKEDKAKEKNLKNFEIDLIIHRMDEKRRRLHAEILPKCVNIFTE